MIFRRPRPTSLEQLFDQQLDGIVTGPVAEDLLRVAEALRSAAVSIDPPVGLQARRGALLSGAVRRPASLPRVLQTAVVAGSVALGSTVGLVGASVAASWLEGQGGSPAGGAPERSAEESAAPDSTVITDEDSTGGPHLPERSARSTPSATPSIGPSPYATVPGLREPRADDERDEELETEEEMDEADASEEPDETDEPDEPDASDAADERDEAAETED